MPRYRLSQIVQVISTFSGGSERSKQAIRQAKHLITQISDEENLYRFEEFSQKLMDCLSQTYSGAAGYANKSKSGVSSMVFD